MPEATGAAARVRTYHQLSKHHLDGYAPGPGRLDWANQPDPFRRYADAPRIDLPLGADGPVDAPGPAASDLRAVARLFELALGLSAWKVHGPSRWALRCNPSSGNLHPTEGYLVCPGLPGLVAGVYHYHSHDHCLEQRATLDATPPWTAAFAGNLLLGLTGIHWREAWKYGARAWRYCQHDAGHAIGAVRYAASCLGWQARLLTAPGDADLERLLGLDRAADFAAAEPEAPEALLAVGPCPDDLDLDALLNQAPPTNWRGHANRLSATQVHWPQIPEVAAATRKPRSTPIQEAVAAVVSPEAVGDAPPPALLRQRRSAVAFDGRTTLPAGAFFELLARLLPRPGTSPWDVLPWRPRIHPVLFVHRVDGVPPGAYVLPRDPASAARLQDAMSAEFDWTEVPGAPPDLPLRCLGGADLQGLARTLSCHQDIAADGCFAVAMLADFDATVDAAPHWYRWLYWEAGLLGQALYLQAEAAGLRGTGIGCYFDDAVHQALGLSGTTWQDLYHFTLGGPVDDARLQTEPPYAHLGQRVTA